jgi:hypothetical protein
MGSWIAMPLESRGQRKRWSNSLCETIR